MRFTIDSFSKKHFQQRLVRHIAFVGESLKLSQECRGQSQRDCFCRRLEVGKYSHASLAPVDEWAGIVLLPKRTFLSLRAEHRNGSTSCSLCHSSFSPATHWPR